MKNEIDSKFLQLLRMAIPPVQDPALKHDLWPRVLQEFNEQVIRVPWFDWALAAVPVICLVLYPELIPILLYLL